MSDERDFRTFARNMRKYIEKITIKYNKIEKGVDIPSSEFEELNLNLRKCFFSTDETNKEKKAVLTYQLIYSPLGLLYQEQNIPLKRITEQKLHELLSQCEREVGQLPRLEALLRSILHEKNKREEELQRIEQEEEEERRRLEKIEAETLAKMELIKDIQASEAFIIETKERIEIIRDTLKKYPTIQWNDDIQPYIDLRKELQLLVYDCEDAEIWLLEQSHNQKLVSENENE